MLVTEFQMVVQNYSITESELCELVINIASFFQFLKKVVFEL